MSADQIVGFVLALIVMLIGVAGAALPALPGSPLVFLAALGHKLWFGDRGGHWWVIAVLAIFMVVSMGLDFLATTLGAKKLGATWRGMIGAMIGAIVGIFFSPIGLLVGTVLGATVCEVLGGREWRDAGKAGVGAALGLLLGPGKALRFAGQAALLIEAARRLLRFVRPGKAG